MTSLSDEQNLAALRLWVSEQKATLLPLYRREITRLLSAQDNDQLTQRAMLSVMEGTYARALEQLAALEFSGEGVTLEQGFASLTTQIQLCFQGLLPDFLQEVARFNAQSCALSNFEDEHILAQNYVATILRDIQAAWKDFSLQANRIVVERLRA